MQGTLTRIASGNVGAPKLSADGSTVVYSRWNNGNWDVERHKDGRTEVISNDPLHDVSPDVSDDGETIVWSRFSSDDIADPKASWDVFMWRSGEVRALAASRANETSPSVSGDGRTVVYTHDDLSQPTGFDIHRWRDGETSVVTDGPQVDTDPFLARDDSRVFFRRKVRFDGGDLWMRDEAGTIKPITSNPLPEMFPTVSGDGRVLAWSQGVDRESDEDVYLFDTSTGRTERVGAPGVDDWTPALSADGSVLAWTQGSQIMLREHGKTVAVTTEGSHGWPALSADGQVLSWVGVDPEDPSSRVVYLLRREQQETKIR